MLAAECGCTENVQLILEDIASHAEVFYIYTYPGQVFIQKFMQGIDVPSTLEESIAVNLDIKDKRVNNNICKHCEY